MVIFHSSVKLYQRVNSMFCWLSYGFPMISHHFPMDLPSSSPPLPSMAHHMADSARFLAFSAETVTRSSGWRDWRIPRWFL